MEITIQQLESLLSEQRRLTIEKCLCDTGYYNKESTDGVSKSLPIDKIKFTENGMNARFPNDFEVLKKYIKNN